MSADMKAASAEAQRLSECAGREVSTVDLLLAMLRTGGSTARLLGERGVSLASLESLVGKVRHDRASPETFVQAAREIASGLSAKQTHTLHLFLAILRSGGAATELLRQASVDPGKLRGVVMRALTAPGDPGERKTARTLKDQSGPESSKAVTDAHRSSPSPSAFAHRDGADWRLVPALPPQVPILHREREVGRLLDLLQAKTARVIGIVGEPGSGRSSLVSALAAASLDPPVLPTGDFGAVSSAGALLQSLHQAALPTAAIVLEGSAWLGPDGGDGVLHLLATAAAGRRWIVTLTPADVRRIELASPDLRNSLETVLLSPPDQAVLLDMIEAGLDAMAATTSITLLPDVAMALLRLSPRYPTERTQPGRALAIAEIALARAERLGQNAVSARDIAAVVGDASGVPAVQLLREDDDRFRDLEQRLAERVVGHTDARARIAAALRRSYAGFRGKRPLASFLLLGPTGVGKTETARAVAHALFDGESALVRIDLSEYSEAHAVARLIGSPPGYLAHEEGGQLTEAVRRRPAAVVLFDELEKASREVLLVLLQVLEDGRLTDGRGRTVDFSSAAIVMTSNLGSECYRRARSPSSATVMALAQSRLPPELWNRIDEVLCYAPLSEAELAKVVARIAADSSERLQSERGIAFAIEDSVIATVLSKESDRRQGARPLRRAFERLVEGPLANEIVAGRLHRGTRLRVALRPSGDLDIVRMM